jgi:hypothetical protein
MATATLDGMAYLMREARGTGRHDAFQELAFAAQAILWADGSCRIGGTMAVALHKAEPAAMSALITRVAGLGISTNDVPRWLNANQPEVLQILAG